MSKYHSARNLLREAQQSLTYLAKAHERADAGLGNDRVADDCAVEVIAALEKYRRALDAGGAAAGVVLPEPKTRAGRVIAANATEIRTQLKIIAEATIAHQRMGENWGIAGSLGKAANDLSGLAEFLTGGNGK